MTVPPTQPKRRRGRVLVLLGSACALALGTVALIMPGAAKAAVCSNQTGNNGGMYYQMCVCRPRVRLYQPELQQQLLNHVERHRRLRRRRRLEPRQQPDG